MLALIDRTDGRLTTNGPLDSTLIDPTTAGYLRVSDPRSFSEEPLLAEMFLAQGRKDEAEAVARRIGRLVEGSPDFPFLRAAALHTQAVVDGDSLAAEEAVALYEVCEQPLVRASALEDAGRLLPRARRNDAVNHLKQALDLYAAARADRDVARVSGLLRERGVRAWASSRRSSEWPELSESELKVVQLVARGATNREVAEQLFLSPHTVNAHLRHVFLRLNIRSRVELARLAAGRDAQS